VPVLLRALACKLLGWCWTFDHRIDYCARINNNNATPAFKTFQLKESKDRLRGLEEIAEKILCCRFFVLLPEKKSCVMPHTMAFCFVFWLRESFTSLFLAHFITYKQGCKLPQGIMPKPLPSRTSFGQQKTQQGNTELKSLLGCFSAFIWAKTPALFAPCR